MKMTQTRTKCSVKSIKKMTQTRDRRVGIEVCLMIKKKYIPIIIFFLRLGEPVVTYILGSTCAW